MPRKKQVAKTAHEFRLPNPPGRIVLRAQREFREETRKLFEERSEESRLRAVVERELHTRVFGTAPAGTEFERAAAELRRRFEGPVSVKQEPPSLPHGFFHVSLGLNILAPPYDFALGAAWGGNRPALFTDERDGTFGVSGTAVSGTNTFGSAGVSLFIVPSHPARRLAIRPHFAWRHNFICRSVGPPTSHSNGSVSVSFAGHSRARTTLFQPLSLPLWNGSSDAWHDESGNDSGFFLAPGSQVNVYGYDYYSVSFTCQGYGDAHGSLFGWSAAAFQLHCRVPFVAVREV